MSRYGRVVRGIWLLVALLVASGCAAVTGEPARPAPAEPTALSLPARPRDLRLDGIEPCSLLTEQQRAELGLDGEPSSGTEPSVLFKGEEAACVVRGFSPRAVTVKIGLVTTTGVELFTEGNLDAGISGLLVQGFPAVIAVPARFPDFCSVLVDVAAGQLVNVQYADGGRKPPIPQDQLCRDATQTADAVISTLSHL
jgi:Protein of unknown function (DUF3558)